MLLTPVRLPPGRARLAIRPSSTGSPTLKTIGIVEVTVFAASAGGVPLGRDHVHPSADEIGGQCGQSIIATIRPTVFDRYVLSFDVPGIAQSLAERGHIRCEHAAGRPGAEEADHRHRLLLRTPANGHPIAAPLSSSTNSRRFITR